MSELLVTQCPYCQTRFRLSQQHLAAAAGNVRCGACLKVFNASLTPAAQPPQAPEARFDSVITEQDQSTPPDSPVPPRQGTLLIHDDLDFDELDLEALGLDESLIDEVNPRDLPPGEPELPQTAITEAQLRADAAEPGLQPGEPAPLRDMDAEFELELDPEADAAALLADDQQTDPLQDLHEDFIASPVQNFGPTPTTQEPEPPEPTAPSSSFGLPLSGSPLRPLSADPSSAPMQGIYLRDKPEYVTPKLSWHQPSEEPAEPLQPEPGEAALRPVVPRLFKTDPEPEPVAEPELGELDIPELRDEPVLFEAPSQRAALARRTWLWGSLSVVAALALLGQFITYNFTALAHDQRTRPLLETACLLAGCELPSRVDISLLRSSNLMVRSHPEFPNALAVDVIIYNRADFAQPFPVLRMSFTDSHGREVASRRFRPEEYLSGELAGARIMPLQTPIHIGLSMLDPGEQAVSYRLDFLSP